MQNEVPANLAANLRALVSADRELAERILLPVEGDHVRVEADGRGFYRFHRKFTRFDVPPGDLEASVAEIDPARPILLFGLGLGEQLACLARTVPEARIVAWERDPWLLRQALIARDFSAGIASGRLRFALGVDLLDVLDERAVLQVVEHPFLAKVYAVERALLERGVTSRRALLATGTLFVGDLAESLRAQGYSLFSVDVRGWSAEELAHTVRRFQPDFLARINYTSGLAEFCEQTGCRLLVWEIDPATDRPLPVAARTDHARLFTYRRANVEAYRDAGFEHVEYLPLAANTSRRKPLVLSDEERAHYEAPVSFVGSSMIEDAQALLARLGTQYAEWHADGRAALAEFSQSLRAILDVQRSDYTRYLVAELFEERFTDYLRHARSQAGSEDPVMLLAESAAAERRLAWVAALARYRVDVWGDAGWKAIERPGVRYRGSARHDHDLTRIYGASRINVDVGRLYQTDIVTMRVFDVLACGGFLIAERSAALEELFEVGVELEAYSSLAELTDKVAHYQRHPEDAEAIARRGRAAVCARHSIDQRVQRMLAALALVSAEQGRALQAGAPTGSGGSGGCPPLSPARSVRS